MSKSLKWILGIISVALVVNLAVVTALLMNNSSNKAKQEVAPTKVEAGAEKDVKEEESPQEDPPIAEDSYADEENVQTDETTTDEDTVTTDESTTDEGLAVIPDPEDYSDIDRVRQEAADYLNEGALEESGAAGTDYYLLVEVLKQAVDSYLYLNEENVDVRIQSESTIEINIPDIYIYAIMEYADANDDRMYYLNELDESLKNYDANQQFYLESIDAYFAAKQNNGDLEEAKLNVKDGEYAVEAAKQFVVEAMNTLLTL